MKRSVKRVTVTDKLSQESRGESYWDSWAMRRSVIVALEERRQHIQASCLCGEACE